MIERGQSKRMGLHRAQGARVLAGLMVIALVVASTGCGYLSNRRSEGEANRPRTPTEITTEAYIYAVPLIDNYKTMYEYAVDEQGAQFKAPFNQLANIARVFTPDDTAIVTPNSDTPYSFLWMDLRAEPLVLSVPAIDSKRYYSIQLIDLYTANFAYIGTRATGPEAGDYLIVGPGWSGKRPEGISKVIVSETRLALALYRTQLFNDADLPNVEAIQAKYQVRTLSEYTGAESPPAAPKIEFIPFDSEFASGIGFIRYLNFMLQFCPGIISEMPAMERFAQLGIGPANPFDPETLTPERKLEMENGVDLAKKAIAKAVRRTKHSAYIFGTRESLGSNYTIKRAAAARIGLYGNSKEEALYPLYKTDASGRPLLGEHRYELRFRRGALPPVKAFWSLTMYDGKSQLLVNNRIDRYLINSEMAGDLVRGPDGDVTIYVQKDSPGAANEANWLPAPDGPFYVVMRLYVPKEEVAQRLWSPPPLKRMQ